MTTDCLRQKKKIYLEQNCWPCPKLLDHYMLMSAEKGFGDRLPDTAVQGLTDNCSAYSAHVMRRFAWELNLEPCTTAVSSPQSNGMAERFVKTMKEDYIAFMPEPDVRTALRNLSAAFTRYMKATRTVRRDIISRENTGGSGYR